MQYKITHKTSYEYSKPVFLEPHYIRLQPTTRPYLVLESFDLRFSTNPAGVRSVIDAENNGIHFCWFAGLLEKLTITSQSIIQVLPYNPLAFIIYPMECLTLPFKYPPHLRFLLNQELHLDEYSQFLADYSSSIKSKVNHDTVQYLISLTTQIHTDFKVIYRHEGEPYTPNHTFENRIGACRDLTHMQVMMLRQEGIAARYVSGYYFIELENPDYELHAWVEAYVPGAGWMGLDPSNGLVVSNAHFPVVASSHYENTMPITGSIRGEGTSLLHTDLHIELIQ